MTKLALHIESLLFVSNYPVSVKKLADITGEKKDDVERALHELEGVYRERKESGIMMMRQGDKAQLVTSPESAKLVQKFIKDETTGELTRASLETLTIIAYRGPVTRFEMEQIRGVNCSIILRNLLIRGLIESREDKKKMEITYSVSFDLLHFLGISKTDELPDFEKLNSAENLHKVLEEKTAQSNEGAS